MVVDHFPDLMLLPLPHQLGQVFQLAYDKTDKVSILIK
jgi:hypothetical protein